MKFKMMLPDNEETEAKKGILASLIFLRSEAKKAQMHETEKFLNEAMNAFFRDMKNAGMFDQNMQTIQDFLRTIMSLNKEELVNFVKLLQFFDNAEKKDKASN